MYMKLYNTWPFVTSFFSLTIVFSRVIHIEQVSVLQFLGFFYSLIMFHSMDVPPLFIHSSFAGYLSCFYFGV